MTGILNKHVENSVAAELGEVEEKDDICSSIAPFYRLPEYKVRYPQTIISALGELYHEYNQAFIPSVVSNTEWDTDYQFCMQEGLPVNFAVQIDMVGLPEGFLQSAHEMEQSMVKEVLRRRIFEIENSLAVYQLLENIFADETGNSFFKTNFRAALGRLRKRFKKPIALLAVTDQKYQAMKEIEFGVVNGEELTDDAVFALSGFDRFFGPDEFREYVAEKGGCDYLLYVRSSDPVDKLRDPSLEVEHPLLGDAEMRRIIKANALTFNVDGPFMDSTRRINDTKEYQSRMGMAFPIWTESDLFSLEFAAHLFRGKKYTAYDGQRLSSAFVAYLESQGVDPAMVESGELHLRAKPAKCAYGCYGHISGSLSNGGKFRNDLRRNLRQRDGGYVIQPEMATPSLTNATNGVKYTYIDRNFFAMVGQNPRFLGGFRSMMPIDSVESKNGRIHGNDSTVWAEITT